MKKFLMSLFVLAVPAISFMYSSEIEGKVSLQNGTTAAFTLYLSSSNTGTTTGRFTCYQSSITLEELNSDGGSATYYLNVLLSTSDAIVDVIDRINEHTNWKATLSAGCYGLQLATGSASTSIDGEGTTDGLQWDVAGKAITLSTGSANYKTVYLNSTLYISQNFEPIKYREWSIQSMNSDLSVGTTMYVYEGTAVKSATTLLDIPRTGLKVFEYPTNLPLPITPLKAFTYIVKFGTWTICSGDSINRSALDYYLIKK